MLTIEEKKERKRIYNKKYWDKWYSNEENKKQQNKRSRLWSKNHPEVYIGRYIRKLKPIEYRFLNSFKKTNKCWKWTGKIYPSGYGKLGRLYAHRFSYEYYKDKIPKDMCICHSCDNPSCVNPDHLWVGTVKDNMHDRDRKGRGRHTKNKKLDLLKNV